MELCIEEGEIPIPIPIPLNSSSATSYGGGTGGGDGNGNGHNNMFHHHRHHNLPPPPPSQNNNNNNNNNHPSSNEEEDHHHHHHDHGSSGGLLPYKEKEKEQEQEQEQKVVIRYRECQKNHAAAMGGNATDGCGEFMPNGEEGTIDSFICSACHCHRNFHRKEVEGEPSGHYHHHHHHHDFFRLGRKFLLSPPPPPPHHHLNHHHKSATTILAPSPEALGYPTPSRTVPAHHMIMPYNIGGGGGGPLLAAAAATASESDEQEEGGGVNVGVARGAAAQPQLGMKKRHRTKFSQEQKDKMLSFAEKVGWKIQKQEESVVQQFCQEIGVKRRVLKVWMHNNKHNLAKKINNLPQPPP